MMPFILWCLLWFTNFLYKKQYKGGAQKGPEGIGYPVRQRTSPAGNKGLMYLVNRSVGRSKGKRKRQGAAPPYFPGFFRGALPQPGPKPCGEASGTPGLPGKPEGNGQSQYPIGQKVLKLVKTENSRRPGQDTPGRKEPNSPSYQNGWNF
jgi:hypothetical protein